jgi:dTMP kinase
MAAADRAEGVMITQPYHPAFVVFEGLDGTGKSTCARMVAERLCAEFLTTPSPEVRCYRDDLIRSYAGSQEAAQLFYLSTVFAASDQIRGLLRQGTTVVLDRYFLSTQAYAAFRGSRLRVDDVAALLLPATLTVFLDAPLDVRRQRLSARGQSAADRETLLNEADVRLRVEHHARAQLPVVGRFLAIDTGRASPDEVVDQVVTELASVNSMHHNGGDDGSRTPSL